MSDEKPLSFLDARGILKVPPGSPPPEVVIRVMRGDLQALTEWQRECIDALWPVARAAVALQGRTNHLRVLAENREPIEDARTLFNVAIDLLVGAVAALDPALRAELEATDA